MISRFLIGNIFADWTFGIRENPSDAFFLVALATDTQKVEKEFTLK
jgi:hypothetical protein